VEGEQKKDQTSTNDRNSTPAATSVDNKKQK